MFIIEIHTACCLCSIRQYSITLNTAGTQNKIILHSSLVKTSIWTTWLQIPQNMAKWLIRSCEVTWLNPVSCTPPAVTITHEIFFKEYMLKKTEKDSLVNLAVVIEDVKSHERVLVSEEFNIRTPFLETQVYAGPAWTFILALKENMTSSTLDPFV